MILSEMDIHLYAKTEEMTFPLSEEDLVLANDLLEYVINSQDD